MADYQITLKLNSSSFPTVHESDEPRNIRPVINLQIFGGFIFKFGSSFVVYFILLKIEHLLNNFDHQRQRCRAQETSSM